MMPGGQMVCVPIVIFGAAHDSEAPSGEHLHPS
jgi:hypothetical protein